MIYRRAFLARVSNARRAQVVGLGRLDEEDWGSLLPNPNML